MDYKENKGRALLEQLHNNTLEVANIIRIATLKSRGNRRSSVQGSSALSECNNFSQAANSLKSAERGRPGQFSAGRPAATLRNNLQVTSSHRNQLRLKAEPKSKQFGFNSLFSFNIHLPKTQLVRKDLRLKDEQKQLFQPKQSRESVHLHEGRENLNKNQVNRVFQQKYQQKQTTKYTPNIIKKAETKQEDYSGFNSIDQKSFPICLLQLTLPAIDAQPQVLLLFFTTVLQQLKVQAKQPWLRRYKNCLVFGAGQIRVMRYMSGKMYVGFIKDNQKVGRGIQWQGDSYFIGNYLQGKREGFGTQTNLKTGQKYRGDWKSGMRHGQGQLVTPTSQYSGNFLHGQPCQKIQLNKYKQRQKFAQQNFTQNQPHGRVITNGIVLKKEINTALVEQQHRVINTQTESFKQNWQAKPALGWHQRFRGVRGVRVSYNQPKVSDFADSIPNKPVFPLQERPRISSVSRGKPQRPFRLEITRESQDYRGVSRQHQSSADYEIAESQRNIDESVIEVENSSFYRRQMPVNRWKKKVWRPVGPC